MTTPQAAKVSFSVFRASVAIAVETRRIALTNRCAKAAPATKAEAEAPAPPDLEVQEPCQAQQAPAQQAPEQQAREPWQESGALGAQQGEVASAGRSGEWVQLDLGAWAKVARRAVATSQVVVASQVVAASR